MIIGIMGQMGSGKDTVADHICLANAAQKIAFADPMKRFIQQVYNFSDDQLWGPSHLRNTPDQRYIRLSKELCASREFDVYDLTPEEHQDLAATGCVHLTPRFALQTLGDNWGRSCCNETWTSLALRTANEVLTQSKRYSQKLGLVRYSERFVLPETLQVQSKHIIIPDCRYLNEVQAIQKVDGVVLKVWRPMLTITTSHASETEQLGIDDACFDHVLVNDGTVEDLLLKVDALKCL